MCELVKLGGWYREAQEAHDVDRHPPPILDSWYHNK